MPPTHSPQLLSSLRPQSLHFVCSQCVRRQPRLEQSTRSFDNGARRALQAEPAPAPVPLRKQLKDEARARKKAKDTGAVPAIDKTTTQRSDWELTVGIEIHAELNTAHKLFSPADTSLVAEPNSHVSVFDAALPGAQPQFQQATLLPALRAAIAFGCDIKRRSGWDRKHYFWWDQPNGYQITQYYEPFARSGQITLYQHDGIDQEDWPSITIGIKQIQMEQDTAKTILQPPSTHLLDFNRVSHPLIEIITLPQIHRPKTGAALVRKVQAVLKAVSANTTGMELGGLRADVNVSVRRTAASRAGTDAKGLEYAGVKGLGQRTEIKNLSSFKAVEDAIVAERDRQIRVLEAGGVVEGETRGWTLGSVETTRLRGKEGEVDYRYMPDPDLQPVVIGQELLAHLRETLPPVPDETLHLLTAEEPYDLTIKDAKTFLTVDDGARLDYYLDVVELVRRQLPPEDAAYQKAGKTSANWVLHELSALQTNHETSAFTPDLVAAETLATILSHLLTSRITLPTAKSLLARAFASSPAATSAHSQPQSPATARSPWDAATVDRTIAAEGLALQPMSEEAYLELARAAVAANAGMADKVREELRRASAAAGDGKAARGKLMWFVGQMVRQGEGGRVQPERAEKAVRAALGV